MLFYNKIIQPPPKSGAAELLVSRLNIIVGSNHVE